MLSLGELLIQRLGRVEFEGHGRLADSQGGSLLAHLLSLQVPFQRIEEESIVGHAVPVENLLLLLCPDAVVLVKEIEERALGLFEGGVGAGLEVSQVREDTFLELLRVLHGPSKGLESESQASDDIGSGNVEEIAPVTGVSLRILPHPELRPRCII